MKFMKYLAFAVLALSMQSSVEASARSSRFPASPPPSMIGTESHQPASTSAAYARSKGAQGLGLSPEGPNKYVSPFSAHQGSAPTLQHERATTDPHHPDYLGVGDPTAAILGRRPSTSKKDSAYVSPFSSHQGSAPTLQHERATTNPHHPDHLGVGDPTAAILGRRSSSSNLPKREYRTSHTPAVAQVQQSPQRPSFFSNFKSNVQNVRGILQPSYRAKQEVKQAKKNVVSLTNQRDRIREQIRQEGNQKPESDPRFIAAQNKVLAGTLDRELKVSLANKSISKQELTAIQSNDASVSLQKERLGSVDFSKM
ncbi:hypothetical protein IPF37_06325 [bacterium]|nr:MAG: hypothetical protein IPF37_06325 [bacterium]